MGQTAGTKPQTFVKQLVGAPVMITLPIAYAVALFFVQVIGLPNVIGALISAALIYAADRFSSEQKWSWKEYAARLVYLVINTAILTLVLMGIISISEAGG